MNVEELDVEKDMEKFLNFLKITDDYAEHFQKFREECVGADALDFTLSVSCPAFGDIVQICHTNSTGIARMCKANKFPALVLSKAEIEVLLKADLPEDLKKQIEEIKEYGE